MRFTSGGKLITARIDGQVNIWDPVGGGMMSSFTGHKAGIRDFAISREGNLVIAGTDNIAAMVDGTTGEELFWNNLGEDRLVGFAWYADGKRGVASLASGKLAILDSALKQSETVVVLKEPAPVLRFSADGKTLAAGGMTGSLSLWDTETWSLRQSTSTHRGAVTSISFDPGARWIASTSADSTLIISDLQSLNSVKKMEIPGAAMTFAEFVSPESILSADSKGRLTSWRVLERPPDTTAPALTILSPARYSQDAPTKVFATQYEIFGLVYDESDIKEVMVGNQKAVVTNPKVQNSTASGAGL
jgi:WD40 repeat protein